MGPLSVPSAAETGRAVKTNSPNLFLKCHAPQDPNTTHGWGPEFGALSPRRSSGLEVVPFRTWGLRFGRLVAVPDSGSSSGVEFQKLEMIEALSETSAARTL